MHLLFHSLGKMYLDTHRDQDHRDIPEPSDKYKFTSDGVFTNVSKDEYPNRNPEWKLIAPFDPERGTYHFQGRHWNTVEICGS